MSKEVISINNVSMKYGREYALDDISLTLRSNRIIGLCGPNGAGKTTLIKSMVGLIRSYDGHITILDHSIGKETKALVSYQPDVITLPNSLTPQRAANEYASLYKDFNNKRFFELIEKLKLPMNKSIKNMSKGMREKFQLALTLSRDAHVYIFDEPIAAVDPASRDSILETIIQYYTKDALLIISTHLIQDIETILDEVIFINEGHLILHENCDDLREERGQSIDQIFREEFKW